jgi:hypothetical protein
MNDLNRRLQETFLFSNTDVRANRSGHVTRRQQARLKAARSGQRLALAIFIVVMVGTLAILGFSALIYSSQAGGPPTEYLLQMVIIAAVVGSVILIGLLSSRRYLTDPTPRKMLMAEGPAQIGRVKPDEARFEIRIGAAKLRLAAEEHLLVFQPGTPYRVFYLPGPVAMILSAEVIGTEAEADADSGENQPLPEQDEVVQRQQHARPILYVLAVLALGIPLAGFAVSVLPGALRWLAMIALLLIAIAFVYWALRRLLK